MTTKLNQDVTFFEALKWASLCIKGQNIEQDEPQFLLLNQMHWDLTTLLRNYRTKMPADERQQFSDNLQRLVNGEPAQYIVGQTYFYGYPMQVNPSVLIPRPETEELVEWILNDNHKDSLKVLDVGTGSGAIAIALKQQRPDWNITASDISADALQVAKSNAELNHVDINFVESDLLTEFVGQKFDIILSNPPYIAHDEEKVMDQDVIDYEPDLALFAKHNGLFIYEELAKTVSDYLISDGKLYLEIGFHQGPAVTDLLKTQNPAANVELRKDLADHDRMIKMNLKGE
ncbi:peptide chain release factor N(5)-glutamine methyltransferase [Fructilactobacillus sp. Tb1]|uniref:peptide chain release factor N(5)-glutamine methyltransferase n=1 Tax=Fructilactobacillus sp. Tb1 TaxID=3422304 RepID=UPI003D2D41AB